jgi:signal transduction histidine kinase/ActR/RegA family two-component response regulator
MLYKILNKNTKKLALLLAIVFVGIFLIVYSNYFFINLIEELDKKTSREIIKEKISRDVVKNIKEIELSFYKMVATLKPPHLKSAFFIKTEIKKKIKETEELIGILEHGGLYEESIDLNIANRANITTKYTYTPPKTEHYKLYTIQLLPKLKKLRSSSEQLYALLEKRIEAYKSNKHEQEKESLKILKRFLQKLPPTFNRINEDANTEFFNTKNKLKELKKGIESDRNHYIVIQMTLILSIIFIVMLLSLIIAREISRANRDLDIQTEEAKKASIAKSEFLANMSHEIRTPLNAILGFLELLKEKEDDKEKLSYINTIDNSSDILLAIINDILDFSKIESGKISIENVDFEVQKEFLSISDLFRAKASEKAIDFAVNISGTIPHTIVSDPLRIKQVISNLISNAIKFTKRHGHVTLDIEFDDANDLLSVSVTDTGIGIAKDKQSAIFEAFSQAEASTTREFGGTGLGLTISYKLVELLGGTLKLESELGEGSRFYFDIPIKVGQRREKKVTKEDQKFSAHILLVEDNTTNQMLMKLMLSKLSLTFDIANDGLEAVEAYQKSQYDLILMDENMPNLNGIGATQKILAIEEEQGLEHTPIVALTANSLQGDRERFISAGMDEYLAKPIKKQKLTEVLSKFLSS